MFPEGRFLEFLLAGVIALIVVGPKDLPILLRKLGQFMAKVRSMASEFRASFDEMARQSELDELRKEVEAMRNAQYTDLAAHVSPEMTQTFEELSQGLSDVGVNLSPTYTYAGEENEGVTISTAPKPRKTAGKTAKKAPVKKAPAKTAPAKKTAAKTPAAKTPAAKSAAKAAPARKAAPATVTASKPRVRKAAGTVT
jgi:sec-independent protein translocase protein TatB